MVSRTERRRKHKSRSHNNKITTIVVMLVLLIATAYGSYIFFGGHQVAKPKRQAEFAAAQSKLNILVLGVDERKNDKGRSDTMFVVTVDQNLGEASILSIPRDTRVKIPGRGWDKINHAYAEGGHDLSRKSVEALFGVGIDYDVVVDFAAFYKIVDAIGGVDIHVEKRMYYEDPYDNLVINIRPGQQHMDGKTAIQYVRYRDGDGDLGRIERQQKFLKTMLEKVASPSVIPRIPAIIREVSSAIQTDISVTDMINLAKITNDSAKKGLKADTVPGKPAHIADVSYWLPDIVALREHIAESQSIPVSEKYLAAARSLQAHYDASIPKEMNIIEVPKQAPPKNTASLAVTKGNEKSPTSNAPVRQPAAAKDSKIKVEIVNSSGVPNTGEKAAALFRNQGFEVSGITAGLNVTRNTVVISYTTNSDVVGKITGLPFRYALQVTKNDSKADIITVILGKDFTEK